MGNVLQIEALKWRRSPLVWVTLASTLATPLLATLLFGFAEGREPTWHDLLNQALLIHTMMIGPLVTTLIGASAISTEYQFDTWKLSLTAPIKRWQVYTAKLGVSLIWCLALSVAALLGTMVGGSLLHLGPFERFWYWAYQWLIGGAGLAIMLPFYHLVTFVSRSFFVTSGAGIVGTFTGILMVSSKWAGYYPIASVPLLLAIWFNSRPGEVQSLVGTQPVWLLCLAATFLLPLLINLVFVKRADLT